MLSQALILISDLILIDGRPTMGKTTFAIDIARYAGVNILHFDIKRKDTVYGVCVFFFKKDFFSGSKLVI